MTETEESAIEEFDETVLVRISPKETTLPIHTAAEWSKGFMLVNVLIKELAKNRYVETFKDNSGNDRSRVMLHPQMLGYIQERRHMMDQIWKLSGGEAVNEMKKETAKKFADFLFKMQTDNQLKEKYKKEAYKIIELEVNEDDEVDTKSQ